MQARLAQRLPHGAVVPFRGMPNPQNKTRKYNLLQDVSSDRSPLISCHSFCCFSNSQYFLFPFSYESIVLIDNTVTRKKKYFLFSLKSHRASNHYGPSVNNICHQNKYNTLETDLKPRLKRPWKETLGGTGRLGGQGRPIGFQEFGSPGHSLGWKAHYKGIPLTL